MKWCSSRGFKLQGAEEAPGDAVVEAFTTAQQAAAATTAPVGPPSPLESVVGMVDGLAGAGWLRHAAIRMASTTSSERICSH